MVELQQGGLSRPLSRDDNPRLLGPCTLLHCYCADDPVGLLSILANIGMNVLSVLQHLYSCYHNRKT